MAHGICAAAAAQFGLGYAAENLRIYFMFS